MSGFDAGQITQLHEMIQRDVDRDAVGGVAWLALRDGHVEAGAAGVLTRGQPGSVARDSIFRIASMTKPMTAVAALLLIEEGRLRLDEPVDVLLPELADRQVLVDGLGPMDGETVPAQRAITVRDVLTFRLGWGINFEAPWPQPLLTAMGDLGLGSGPPEPQGPPPPDEWIARLGTLPLQFQPGERWLYNVGSDVLGVLIARAAGQPLEVFMRERVFEPLGMVDTGFATDQPHRLGSCYGSDPMSGERFVYDAPDGQWTKPPAFPSAAGGLVSTVDDVGAFAAMLLSGGRLENGTRLLSRASVEAMTTDHLRVAFGGRPISPDGAVGWGLGVGVQVHRVGLSRTVGSYGWDGGLGSSWANDPTERLAGVILTTDMFAGANMLPEVIQDFWTGIYAALAD